MTKEKYTVAEQWLLNTLPRSADVDHVPTEVLDSLGLVRMDEQRVFLARNVYKGYITDNNLYDDSKEMTDAECLEYAKQHLEPEDYEYYAKLGR